MRSTRSLTARRSVPAIFPPHPKLPLNEKAGAGFRRLAMKHIVIPCLLAAAFGVSAIAQQPAQPRRVVPPAPNIIQPGQPAGHPQGPEPVENTLPHNVKLQLGGSVFGIVDTDQSVTTGGREVLAYLDLGRAGEQPVIANFQATLTPGEPWQAAISLGVQCPIQSKSGSIEYRDLIIRTTVRIAPGKKVVLWQKGDQKLTLTMTEEKE
jgi:hypothetical protein